MSNYLVIGTSPDDPPEYGEPEEDAGVGHFDGLTPIEEVKQSFERPQIAGVDW